MNELTNALQIQNLSGLILGWVGQALLFGTVLALITWAVLRCFGRRLHPALHAILWMVVLAKFLVPVGPGFSFSLASAARGLTERVGINEIEAQSVTVDRTATTSTRYIAWLPIEESTATISAEITPQKPWHVGTILCGLYLAGVLAAGAVRIWSYRQFAVRCRNYPTAGPDIRNQVTRACHALGVRRHPDVRISDDAPAPFVYGIRLPMLVLSRRQLFRPDELEAVILHEVAHLRRGDLIVRYLQWIAGTLLFFWPVVAWVNRRIDLAREHACDEWALRHGQLSAGQYARCLLNAVQPVGTRGWLYRPAAMATNPKIIERRIEMILDTPARRSLGGLLRLPVLLLVLSWAAFALTGAAVAEDPQEGEVTSGHQSYTVTKTFSDDGNETVDVRVIATEGELEDMDAIHARLAEHGVNLDELKSRLHTEDGGVWIQKVELAGIETGDEGDFGAHMRAIELQFAEELAQFAEDYPAADADGDGTVTRFEREAYLVALAMSDPTAFINQFPKADLNEDGVLEPIEAARTIRSGKNMFFFEPMMNAIHAVHEDGANVIQADEMIIQMEVQADVEGEEGQVHRIEMLNGGKAMFVQADGEEMESASDWLLKNIDAEISAEDVASYLGAVEESCGFKPVWIEEADGEEGTLQKIIELHHGDGAEGHQIIIDRLMDMHGQEAVEGENTFFHNIETDGSGSQTITIHQLGDHVQIEVQTDEESDQ